MSYSKITTSTVLTVPTDSQQVTNRTVVIDVDSTAGVVTVTLPAISAFPVAFSTTYVINDFAALSSRNNIIIAANAADKINNAASFTIANDGGSAIVQMSGLNDWSGVSSLGGLPIVACTATSDGLTTGIIANGNCFVNVTSANANNIIALPSPVPGTIVRLLVGATGFELRSNSPTTVAINGGTGSAAESAIAANTYVEMQCVSATAWIGRQYTTAGVQTAVEVAAP